MTSQFVRSKKEAYPKPLLSNNGTEGATAEAASANKNTPASRERASTVLAKVSSHRYQPRLNSKSTASVTALLVSLVRASI